MIDRQPRKIRIHCDSCPEVFEGADRALWQETWDTARRNGWRSRHNTIHVCPKCGAPT